MKHLKKVLIILIILVLSLFFVLLLDYARLNVHYLINRKNYTETFDVQGNLSNYVP